MKEIRPCPLCPEIFREHGCNIGIAIRNHMRDKHPVEFKEITDVEHEIREKKHELKRKYPNVEIFT